MGIRIEGLDETLARLTRVHKRTNDAQLEELYKAGKDIAKLARSNAPIKTGALERSIKDVPVKNDVRGRYSVYVGVDERELGIGYQKYGFRYDEHLHERPFNLGPLSRAKADAGNDVGFEFLARALRELEDGIARKMQAIADKEALDV